MATDFISLHVINKIKQEIDSRKLSNRYYYYFDVPIKYYYYDFNRTIDRFKINHYGCEPYIYGINTPFSWHILTGNALLESLKKIKSNEFYFFKDGIKTKI